MVADDDSAEIWAWSEIEVEVGNLLDAAVAALGGSRRDGQHTMAEAVVHAVERGEHLLVQAGTGTGKSLAYLVPAVRHAVLADERVVISTATLALQRQLLTRDLPLVTSAVAPRLSRTPRIALLKGWHNYVCRHRLDGGYPEEEPAALFDVGEVAGAAEHPDSRASDLGRQVLAVRSWAEQTETGDRDDLVPGVSDRAWRQVSVTARECLGQKCPMISECFPDAARRRAHEADVVVTNHAMLGIAADQPSVLPEHDLLIVDEAHELADRVTAQATAELSASAVLHAATAARRQSVDVELLESAAQGLAVTLSGHDGRFAAGMPADLMAAVGAVRDAAREILSALRQTQRGASPDGGTTMATSAVTAVFEVTERLLTEPGRDVLWVARDLGQGPPRLLAAPLDVAGLVAGNLFAGRSAVLTSATLTLGGSFAPLARTVGLWAADEIVADRSPGDDSAPTGANAEPTGTDGEPGSSDADQDAEGSARLPWRGIDVGSPFDHARAGILYVARHLPPPGRGPATDAQLDEIADLIRASGGATLGLFSSRRAAEAAAEAMRERLDVPVLCQGEEQLPTLVEQFATDEATCLFGTLSLWQGVDVPGPSCRLVLIDRIPFPRPDDPVRSARSEAVAAAGGNGFMAVSATHAALLLAQGAGRLLRTDTDRGVVAVLDPRLATARYGEFLAGSLPPFWRTTDREAVLGALTRLAARSVPESRA